MRSEEFNSVALCEAPYDLITSIFLWNQNIYQLCQEEMNISEIEYVLLNLYKWKKYLTTDLPQRTKYSPIAQEVTGSIPIQYKHLFACTCLLVLGLGVFYVHVCIYKNKVCKYVFTLD
jgi:hypothetical protein